VLLKKTTRRVQENGEGDRFGNVLDTNFQVLIDRGLMHRLLEHDLERLERKLIHRMDLVQVVEYEVEKGSSRGCGSVMFARFVDFHFGNFRFLHFLFDLSGCEVSAVCYFSNCTTSGFLHKRISTEVCKN